MNSKNTDIYQAISSKSTSFLSYFENSFLNELYCYISFNTHNELIKNHNNNEIECLNLIDNRESKIHIYNQQIEYVPISTKLSSYDNIEEECDANAFVIEALSSVIKFKNIRVNSNGLFIENYYLRKQPDEKLSEEESKVDIETSFYDWISIKEMYKKDNNNQYDMLTKESLTPTRVLYWLIEKADGVYYVTDNNITKKYQIEPDEIIKVVHAEWNYYIKSKLKVYPIEFSERMEYLFPPTYDNNKNIFYADYINYMLKNGYYKDNSLQLMLKSKAAKR